MKFRPDNQIKYGQDFSWFKGIPSGVEFRLTKKSDGKFVLRGPGYGLQGDYGCGALHVFGLNSKQTARFERCWQEQEKEQAEHNPVSKKCLKLTSIQNEEGDWQVIYVNGVYKCEGHTVPLIDICAALGVEYENLCLPGEEMVALPEKLEETAG